MEQLDKIMRRDFSEVSADEWENLSLSSESITPEGEALYDPTEELMYLYGGLTRRPPTTAEGQSVLLKALKDGCATVVFCGISITQA